MNRRGVVRCTCSLNSVGTTVVYGTPSPTPPKKGRILYVSASFGGAATKISSLIFDEGSGNNPRVSYTDELVDFSDSPGDVPYSTANFRVGASTDDVGVPATSTVSVVIDIEVL